MMNRFIGFFDFIFFCYLFHFFDCELTKEVGIIDFDSRKSILLFVIFNYI